MWSSGATTWPLDPQRLHDLLRRRIQAVFPRLGNVAIAEAWNGANGHTIHGMPQVGQLRRGLWVASGFGKNGLAASTVAGQLVASGIVNSDDRWRMFSPFELISTGGVAGRIVGQGILSSSRHWAQVSGALARWRERTRLRERQHAVRHERAVRATEQTPPPAGPPRRRAPGAGPPPPRRREPPQRGPNERPDTGGSQTP